MKLLAILLVTFGIVGCAGIKQNQSLSYEQLEALKVTNADCSNIEIIIPIIEQSLRNKGLLYKDPEQMNENDRKYNSKAHSIIWALRIGCANPNRYDK